jgi:F-type H+-transporting ATPase subunit a
MATPLTGTLATENLAGMPEMPTGISSFMAGAAHLAGTTRLLATDITVGDHLQKTLFGLTFNLDTIWATVVAGLAVIILGLVLRAKATSGVPGKMQVVWEMVVGGVRQQVEGSTGNANSPIVPFAVALFLFILIANWFSVFGIGSHYEWLAPPTGDINLTLALAIIVIIPVHIVSIRSKGLGGYIRHYFEPYKVLTPINIIEEIAKPITLALRLFGNLLSGGLMLTLIAALGVVTIAHVPVGDVFTLLLDVIWKLFDLAIGAIQAFIFALLTILYFDAATAKTH